MKYNKFFNSNPSVSGNNAMSNIEALAKFDAWLAGQEIIDISAGENQGTYTPLTFTKENGETYTVNIPTVRGATGEQGLSINSVHTTYITPTVGGVVTLNTNDFNRNPTTNEKAIMFVINNGRLDIEKLYITEITVNTISGTTVSCTYNSVNEISEEVSIKEFSYAGKWAPNNNYRKNDCVYYNPGSTELSVYYICRENVSNSTTPPVNDTTHWDFISINASKYSESYISINKDKLQIQSANVFPISDNSFIHFVTVSDDGTDMIIVDTLCITNSSAVPSIDDFLAFLRKVAPNQYQCLMASGKKGMGDNTEAIINGMFWVNTGDIKFRQYRISG